MKIEKLTESEELVMKSIWDCKKEPVLSDVVDRVNGFYGSHRRFLHFYLSLYARII